MPREKEKIDPDAFYWAGEVARILFGRSVDWFYKQHASLKRDENFPPPISEIGRPRWSGKSLIAWRDRDDSGTPARVGHGPADTSNVVNYTAVLNERARRVARQGRRES